MEHIEIDVASAGFFLFKVLCRRRNGDILAARFSMQCFSTFPSCEQALDFKNSSALRGNNRGLQYALTCMALQREKGREKGKETMLGLPPLK